MRERPENRALIAGERYTILEVLNPENRTLIAGERSTLTLAQFFNFPGTVLPFFYFSVVRKVPEKPVLFLPHPNKNSSLVRSYFSRQ